ncbi:MAG: SNF2-related protein [Parafilimonas sp.]
MSLPYLVKYIYNNGTDEVIRRGKIIYAAGNIELLERDELLSSVVFRLKDDLYSIYYKVHIHNFKNAETLSLRCSCPYNLGDICRHEAAALLRLQDMTDKNLLYEKEQRYHQKHTVVKMKQLDYRMIKLLSAPSSYTDAQNFLRSNKINIIEAANEKVTGELVYGEEHFKIIIKKNEERNFDTRCPCHSEPLHPLCVHKIILFLQLLNNYGPNYFDTIRNLDNEKEKLLSLYGYSSKDDLNGKFEFTYKEGKPYLRVLDASIKRVGAVQEPKPAFIPQQQDTLVLDAAETIKPCVQLGVVISYDAKQYPYIQFDAIQGEASDEDDAFAGKVERLDLTKFINTEIFSEEDKMLVQQLRKLLSAEVNKYLNRNSPFSGIWENIIQEEKDDLPEETRHLIAEYLHPKYKKLFDELSESKFVFYLPAGNTFQTSNLQSAVFSGDFLKPEFTVLFKDGLYEIECKTKLNEILHTVAVNEIESPILFKKENVFYTWQKAENILLAEKFLPSGKITITAEDWNKQLTEFILPLSKEYHVQFINVQKEELRDVKPEAKIVLKEKGDYLLFHVLFTYRGYEVKQHDKERIIQPSGDKLLIIHRSISAEKEIIHKIETLHSGFIKPAGSDALALKGIDVLKNNWFFLFTDVTKEMNIPVYGFDALKNFRFNTAKPSTKIYISNNTDWFDAKIDIHFGSQKVTVADIKKALVNKQQFVPLPDGTLGILPESWIQKYSLLFRVGEGKATSIKLSKYHFSVIEDLYEKRDEEELVFKLEQKYEQLKDNYSITNIEPPPHLKNILRPYQLSGFQWLNYLSEIQWSGILADDMGLGKTIQALCFLYYLKQKQSAIKALVICPTTLIYNWENEIKKFTPSLTYIIHHGGARTKETLIGNSADIIISTYGTLRSDIKQFTETSFDYVILDESQAIKNPFSKVAKAATLLNAKNKLCLSGTPLQNNTFDIYAQMNFLNPGMLGSVEFFRNEFAVPIDKFGEKEQKEHLRKVLYPFILRRTKEQVAKDLPEKSEMILFCEMGEEQRNIYNAYRNDYRDKILGVVEERGIQRSQLTILQGLMRLRQICDSPSIIKDEKYPNVSVKLEEICREITENISNHKALVFSQFLGMLVLIKGKLEELEIDYEYFDGSTPVADREKAIQRFQNDENCRVFLISLKAGGVGLNLTAADYVYIVDPWWNPAVEQQAIDRTHRIGQTKNVFAYRMICKDTVEDKIIKLQEKKKALAADLITDDTGFIKSLTKEDIEYLFS